MTRLTHVCILQSVAVCCNVLHCVVMCCNVLYTCGLRSLSHTMVLEEVSYLWLLCSVFIYVQFQGQSHATYIHTYIHMYTHVHVLEGQKTCSPTVRQTLIRDNLSFVTHPHSWHTLIRDTLIRDTLLLVTHSYLWHTPIRDRFPFVTHSHSWQTLIRDTLLVVREYPLIRDKHSFVATALSLMWMRSKMQNLRPCKSEPCGILKFWLGAGGGAPLLHLLALTASFPLHVTGFQ